MWKGSIGILFVCTSLACHAGNQEGKISRLYARAGDNLHLVELTGGTKTNSPACATNGYWLIKDENSTAGKSQFSQLLAAQLAGKTVAITGLGTCTRWSDGEDINVVVIK